MVKLYTEDMESNYIKTGSHYNNTYIADDLLTCQSLVENLKDLK